MTENREERTGTMTRIQNYERTAALTVALAPVVLLVAFLAHPFLVALPDAEVVGEAVAAGPTRWGIVHLLTNVASALLALAFLGIRRYLHAAGEDRFSTWGLPLVVFGSVLYGFLPGIELAPMAAAETGGDVAAVQATLEPWFLSMFAAGVLSFGAGILAFARGIARSRILSRRAAGTVVAALVVMAVARAVPLGVIQFHVQGVAGVVALWPLAHVMWRRPGARNGEPAVSASHRRPAAV